METQKSPSKQSDKEKEKKKKHTEPAKSGSLSSDYTTKL